MQSKDGWDGQAEGGVGWKGPGSGCGSRAGPAGRLPDSGAAGQTHQDGHLHDVGLLKELRVHGRPRLKQHAGVPGIVGAQLPGDLLQACNAKAQRVTEHAGLMGGAGGVAFAPAQPGVELPEAALWLFHSLPGAPPLTLAWVYG